MEPKVEGRIIMEAKPAETPEKPDDDGEQKDPGTGDEDPAQNDTDSKDEKEDTELQTPADHEQTESDHDHTGLSDRMNDAKLNDGKKLPDTATNDYNLLVIGIIFLTAGTATFLIMRKKMVNFDN